MIEREIEIEGSRDLQSQSSASQRKREEIDDGRKVVIDP